MLLILFTPLKATRFEIEDMYPSLPAYRFSFITILTFLSCSVLISVFRRYRVNYVLIFELNLRARVREA